MSAEPVVPGEPALEFWLMGRLSDRAGWWQVWRGDNTLLLETKAQACAVRDALNAVARPALPAPPDLQAKAWKKLTEEYEMVVMALDRGDFDWQKERKDVLHQLSTALKMWRLGAALPAPEPPPGPWRVTDSRVSDTAYCVGYQDYRFGAFDAGQGWTRREAQAVVDALNGVALPAPEPPRLWHCEKCNHDFTGGPIHQCNDGFIANAVRVDAARTSATVASGATALAGAALPAEHAPPDLRELRLSLTIRDLISALWTQTRLVCTEEDHPRTMRCQSCASRESINRAEAALLGSRPALAGSPTPIQELAEAAQGYLNSQEMVGHTEESRRALRYRLGCLIGPHLVAKCAVGGAAGSPE